MTIKRPQIAYSEGECIQPTNAYKRDIEEYAQRVASAIHFEIGSDLKLAVERLGGRVSYVALDEMMNQDGSIFVHQEADFDIILPQYTSPKRDRFTIAHELGHYFLHSRQGEVPIVAYRQGSSRIEWEANWFAAALLMPAEEFREACLELEVTSAVANRFGVSEDAAEVRRKALNA